MNGDGLLSLRAQRGNPPSTLGDCRVAPLRAMTYVLLGHEYRLAVARTAAQRSRGLAGTTRAEWAGYDGLLLRMPWAARWPIWMRGMRMPIRVLWMRRGVVVGEIARLTPQDGFRLHWPPCAVDAIVELFAEMVT